MSTEKYRVSVDVDNTNANRKLDDTVSRVRAMNVGFSALKGAIAGAFGVAALTQFSRGVTGVYTEYEKLRTVLSTTLGSQAAANQEFARLQALANELPQDLQDVSQAFVKMRRFGLDTTNDGLRAFSNIATASGKSMDQLAEALADAMTGEFERLKEFGIKVRRENDKMIASFGSQQVAVANSSEELVKQLQELGRTKFGSAAEENANTLGQSLSNLRGAVYEASIAFMEGLAPALKVNTDQMALFIRQNNTLIASMGEGVGEALRTIGAFTVLVSKNIDLVTNSLLFLIGTRLFSNIQTIFAKLSQSLGQFGGTAKLLENPIKAIGTAIVGATSGFVKFLGPIALGVTAVASLTALFNAFEDEIVTVGETTTTYGEIANAVFSDLLQRIGSFVNSSIAALTKLWNDSTGAVFKFYVDYKSVFDGIGGLIKEFVNTFIGAILLIGAMVAQGAMGIGDTFVTTFKLIGRTLSEFVSRAGAQFGSLFDFIASGGKAQLVNAFAGFGEFIVEGLQKELTRINEQYAVDLNRFFGRDFLGEAGAVVGEYFEDVVLASRAAAAGVASVTEEIIIPVAEATAIAGESLKDIQAKFEKLRDTFSDIRSLDEYIAAFNAVTALSAQYGAENEEVIKTFDALKNALRGAQTEFENLGSIDEYIATLQRWRAAQADGVISSLQLGDALKDLAGEFSALVEPFTELMNIDEFNSAFQYFTNLLETGQIGITEYKDALDALSDGFDHIDFALSSSIPTLAEYDAQLKVIEAALESGRITMAQFRDAKAELDESFLDSEGIGSFISKLGQAQAALSQDLATALLEGKSVMESFKNFFKSLISQIIADIIRLSILQPIISSIFGAFGFTPTFGAGGNITSIGRRATGGPVVKDKPYVVGERGPELFVPTGGGSIVPNDRMGGGKTEITYNIQAVDARSFQQLLASDPEYLYSVTQAGSRRVPR